MENDKMTPTLKFRIHKYIYASVWSGQLGMVPSKYTETLQQLFIKEDKSEQWVNVPLVEEYDTNHVDYM